MISFSHESVLKEVVIQMIKVFPRYKQRVTGMHLYKTVRNVLLHTSGSAIGLSLSQLTCLKAILQFAVAKGSYFYQQDGLQLHDMKPG